MSDGVGEVKTTSSGLRKALFETLEDLRTGKMEPAKAKAIAAVAHQICETVKMEIEVAKILREVPGSNGKLLPLRLELT